MKISLDEGDDAQGSLVILWVWYFRLRKQHSGNKQHVRMYDIAKMFIFLSIILIHGIF